MQCKLCCTCLDNNLWIAEDSDIIKDITNYIFYILNIIHFYFTNTKVRYINDFTT